MTSWWFLSFQLAEHFVTIGSVMDCIYTQVTFSFGTAGLFLQKMNTMTEADPLRSEIRSIGVCRIQERFGRCQVKEH